VGTSVYLNDGNNDIKESLKIADEEMYKMKGSKKKR
jgi:hypothetical protein